MNSPRGAIKLWCLLTIFLLYGCTKPAFNIQTTFTEDELAPYAKNGTATVIGQAFLKTQGGDVKYAAGNKITLMPVTYYTTEIVTAATSETYSRIENLDSRFAKYRRYSLADGEGRFVFNDIPPDNYYVLTHLTWKFPGPYRSLLSTGGYIVTTITVREGEKVKVVLTR